MPSSINSPCLTVFQEWRGEVMAEEEGGKMGDIVRRSGLLNAGLESGGSDGMLLRLLRMRGVIDPLNLSPVRCNLVWMSKEFRRILLVNFSSAFVEVQ